MFSFEIFQVRLTNRLAMLSRQSKDFFLVSPLTVPTGKTVLFFCCCFSFVCFVLGVFNLLPTKNINAHIWLLVPSNASRPGKENKRKNKNPTLIFWTVVRQSWQPPTPLGSKTACYLQEPSPCQRPFSHLRLSNLKSPTQLPELPASRLVDRLGSDDKSAAAVCANLHFLHRFSLSSSPRPRQAREQEGREDFFAEG